MRRYLLIISVLLSATALCFGQEHKSIHQEESEYYKNLYPNGFPLTNENNIVLPAQNSTKACDLNRKVFGFHPSWNNSIDYYGSYDWNLISDFCYFDWQFNTSSGAVITSNSWATAASVTTAQNNGVRVHLCVTLMEDHATFLTNSAAKTAMINNLISALQARNADGVNIDFEAVPIAQKANLTAFMIQLSNAVKTAIPGIIVSIDLPAVDWSIVWDIPALINYVDWFIIMGYDYYYAGSTTAGPVGPLYTFETSYARNLSRSITFYESSGVEPQNLILALPYYGREWSTTSGTVPSTTIANISSRTYSYIRNNPGTYSTKKWEPNSFTPYFSYNTGTEWRQCFVDDEVSLKKRYDLVNIRDLGGIGIWALGYDDGYSELWQAIEDKFTTCAIVPCSDTIWDLGGPTRTYNNLEDFTYTISPNAASSVSLNFTSFDLYSTGDTLWLYNGASDASPIIGTYTGTNSPGNVSSSGPDLTVKFYSNSANASNGWQAIWNCVSDNTPPTTDISVNRKWQQNDFVSDFTDYDGASGSGIKYPFYQVMDYNGTEWRANDDFGFFNDNFGTAIHPDWTIPTGGGTWSISAGHLLQSDQTNTNTNIYASLSQTAGNIYLYHWQQNISGSGTNRRSGIHFFCSDATQTGRDDSYMVYLRADNNTVQLYKYVNNSYSTGGGWYVTGNYTIDPNIWYDVKIILNPTTGEISCYINDNLAITTTDAAPLTSGNAISLRTGECTTEYDDFKVYVSRTSTENISLGIETTNEIRYQSPSSAQDAGRIRSLVIDNANLWSQSASENIYVDWTVPTTSLSVVNEWQTNDFTASFTDTDLLSGIEKRFYQVCDNTGTKWTANPEFGFICDSLNTLNSEWTSQTGTWQINSGVLVQTNQSLSNTNIHTYLKQDLSNRYLYEFDMKYSGSNLTRRLGFHYFCDDPTLDNRGNSYFIWFRDNTQMLEFYKVTGNVFTLEKSVPITIQPSVWYNIKLVYDRITGDNLVYINNLLAGEWKDETPFNSSTHANHSYVSFRSGNCEMSVKNLNVFRTRNASSAISVGDANSMIRYQNPASNIFGAKINSIVTDSAQNISTTQNLSLDVDWTVPSSFTVKDGYGTDIDTTYNLNEISANWTNAIDLNSGIAKYYYAVGTSPGASNFINWTDNGNSNLFVNSSVTLVDDQLYYISVKAENGAGLQTAIYTSDGVRAVIQDVPIVPDCPSNLSVCLNEAPFELTGVDPTGGTFTGAGVEDNVYFNPSLASIGNHTITYDFFGETCQFSITVNDIPVVSCPADIIISVNDDAISLSGASPSGGIYYINGIEISTFDPNIYGVGEYQVTYTYISNPENCENSCIYNITVFEPIVVNCPDDFSVCANASDFNLSGATPEGGIYSGNSVTGIVFSPQSAGVGSHIITYTFETLSCDFSITVDELPVLTCPTNITVTDQTPVFILEDASPENGDYSIEGNTVTNFDPTTSGIGDFTVVYTYTDPSTNCTQTCEFIITVQEFVMTELQNVLRAEIFPNPNNGSFILKYEATTDTEYKLYDTQGRIVDQGILLKSNTEKDFNLNLTAGVYIISYVSGTNCLNERIVVN